MDRSRQPDQRPRVVLITGAPGSGKSTLGAELAAALRIPFLARDDVRGGLFFTAGAWNEHPRRVPTSDEAVETLLRMVETTAALGVSCIVEYVIRQERPSDFERIAAVADCVVLVTTCLDAMSRFAHRTQRDRLLSRQPVLDALGYETIEEHATDAASRMKSVIGEMQTEFDVPTMHVNTDRGYEPGLDRIIDFVVAD